MKLFIVILFLIFSANNSIYNLSYTKIEGGIVSLNEYNGKKLLLVNIATSSNKVNQIGQLKQLQSQFSDSLVIIGFPSNSFGNENKNDLEIKSYCDSIYQINFSLAKSGSVIGESIQPIYKWLSDSAQSGLFSSKTVGDFQKYLINSQGQLVAVFSGHLSPLSSHVITAIQNN